MKQNWRRVQNFLKRTDLLLFGLCLAASIFGIIIISSATQSNSRDHQFVLIQSAALVIGMGLFFFFTLIDVDVFAEQWGFLVCVEVLMLLLLIPFGMEAGGNTGWINLGIVSFQPTELVKIIYIVVNAKHLAYLKEYRDINSPLSILQLAAHFGLLFALIMVVSQDLGSALVFFFIFVIMLFVAGVKLYWFLFGGAAMAVVIPLAWTYVLNDRHKERIMAPYDPTIDPLGTDVNWQPFLAKKAISSGRMSGTGLYNGPQTQSNYLDSQHADYIFASAGEELGFIGCVAILLLLVVIILRCVNVGLHSRNSFGMLMCFGLVASLTFQTFINIGMSIGLTPVIGITLPFFSYGGSSMFTTFAAMGLVSGVHYRPRQELYQGGY